MPTKKDEHSKCFFYEPRDSSGEHTARPKARHYDTPEAAVLGAVSFILHNPIKWGTSLVVRKAVAKQTVVCTVFVNSLAQIVIKDFPRFFEEKQNAHEFYDHNLPDD